MFSAINAVPEWRDHRIAYWRAAGVIRRAAAQYRFMFC
jgi:hypothetical protein